MYESTNAAAPKPIEPTRVVFSRAELQLKAREWIGSHFDALGPEKRIEWFGLLTAFIEDHFTE